MVYLYNDPKYTSKGVENNVSKGSFPQVSVEARSCLHKGREYVTVEGGHEKKKKV